MKHVVIAILSVVHNPAPVLCNRDFATEAGGRRQSGQNHSHHCGHSCSNHSYFVMHIISVIQNPAPVLYNRHLAEEAGGRRQSGRHHSHHCGRGAWTQWGKVKQFYALKIKVKYKIFFTSNEVIPWKDLPYVKYKVNSCVLLSMYFAVF